MSNKVLTSCHIVKAFIVMECIKSNVAVVDVIVSIGYAYVFLFHLSKSVDL